MNISILGAGAFGQALAKILKDNGHNCNFYDPYLFPETSLEAACEQAQAVVIATPSSSLNNLLENYPERLKALPTILTSKGIFSAELFQDFAQFSAISGPAFASEILEGKPASFTASAPFAMGLFQNQQVTIELCPDLQGILLCGTLKNIYAIGSGYHSGSENSEASFLQHAHTETKTYLKNHGANPETAELACGLGDLILTCTNDTSRNFQCGQRIAQGDNIANIKNDLRTIEGYDAIFSVDTDECYPLIRQIAKLCGRDI